MSIPHNIFEPNLDSLNSPSEPKKACVRAFQSLSSNSYPSPLQCVSRLLYLKPLIMDHKFNAFPFLSNGFFCRCPCQVYFVTTLKSSLLFIFLAPLAYLLDLGLVPGSKIALSCTLIHKQHYCFSFLLSIYIKRCVGPFVGNKC